MSALLAGALLSGGSALLQGIVGGVQAARGRKGFERTLGAQPQYEIPQEYENILSRYKQSYAGNMPGYDQMLSQTGQAGARARGAAERGAISSTAYGSQVGDIYQKELDAIQGLGIKQAEYKQAQLAGLSQAEGQLGQQKSAQWEMNKYMPWQTEMNRYGEMQKGGVENIFKGIQSGVGTMTDFLGTKYAVSELKKLYPKNE